MSFKTLTLRIKLSYYNKNKMSLNFTFCQDRMVENRYKSGLYLEINLADFLVSSLKEDFQKCKYCRALTKKQHRIDTMFQKISLLRIYRF